MNRKDYFLRCNAIQILQKYDQEGGYLGKFLNREYQQVKLNESQRQFLTEIVNGVIRWRSRLDWIVKSYYHENFERINPFLLQTLRVAFYQLSFFREPKIPVVVNESTEIVKQQFGDRLGKQVNAILRNYLRNPGQVNENFSDELNRLSIWYSHPKWIIQRWLGRYGSSETERLCEANNRRPNLSVRIDLKKSSSESIETWFTKQAIPWKKSQYLGQFYLLERLPHLYHEIDRFCTIQDESGGLVVALVAPQLKEVVVDLCAAPGGKVTGLGEWMGDEGTVLAVDVDEDRIKLIEQNIQRLSLKSVKVVQADARTVEIAEADKILIDAPCSGLGTLRRKTDIRWNRKPDDLKSITDLQMQILSRASQIVKKGGSIIYSTCTIEPEENEEMIANFLLKFPNFELEDASRWLPQDVCLDKFLYTFPHKQGMDGAFGARLKRTN